MKHLVALLLVCVLLSTAAFGEIMEKKYEGEGFDSPEEAAIAYVEAFNAGDIQSMLSTFAIESFVDNVDRVASIERMSAISMSNPYIIPLANDYIREIEIIYRYGELAEQLLYQYMTYNVPWKYEEVLNGRPLRLSEENGAQDFVEIMNSPPMSDWYGNIMFERLVDPDELTSNFYSSETNQNSIRKQATTCGCDEIRSIAIRMNISGVDCLQYMDCIRYGDKWYNFSFSGNMGSILHIDYNFAGLIR